MLEYTEQRLLATDAALDPPAYPVRTNPDGSWLTVGADDWTAGFYAAALWRTYERTHDPAWRQRAETWQAGLASETKHDNTDLGFKLFDTYGVGYQLTGDASYKQVVLDAADTVARRYDPDVGMFRVWDDRDDRTQYRVNIDAMMNLELMFWAGQNGGDPQYAEMAKHHAQRALQDLVRPDGRTWMFAGYDQDTGTLLEPLHQAGLRDRVDLVARAGLGRLRLHHGLPLHQGPAVPRRRPPHRRLLRAATFRRTTSPTGTSTCRTRRRAPRDTSAAAVAASALLELSGYETDPAAKQRDIDTARDILTSLSSPTYAPREPEVRGDAAARHPAPAQGLGRHRHHVRRLLLRRGARPLREAGGFDRGVHVGLTIRLRPTKPRATPRRPARRR